jgi:hypothetical protein
MFQAGCCVCMWDDRRSCPATLRCCQCEAAWACPVFLVNALFAIEL